MMRRYFGITSFVTLFVCAAALLLAGCSAFQRVGMALVYRKAVLPREQVIYDISYTGDLSADSKHRLDLFIPKQTNWPVLIFVHGGGWNTGDKGLRIGGADVYGNIGRYFAARSVGVAVINYRLQPGVAWRDQVADVSQAMTWVRAHVGQHGGNPSQIFLSGHSAGGQLAAYAALKANVEKGVGDSSKLVSGVICVSGAGLDLADEETYRRGQSRSYYQQRFESMGSENWRQNASPVAHVNSLAPPFLILYGANEKPGLKRQSHLLQESLAKAEVKNEIIEVPGQSHSRMVLTLSRSDKISAPAILQFIRQGAVVKPPGL